MFEQAAGEQGCLAAAGAGDPGHMIPLPELVGGIELAPRLIFDAGLTILARFAPRQNIDGGQPW